MEIAQFESTEVKSKRRYLPSEFSIDTWDNLKPYFDQLLAYEPESEHDFIQWLHQISEIDNILMEDIAWRYIKMTCDTADVNLRKHYEDFINHIQPHLARTGDSLNKKIVASPYASQQLDSSLQLYFRKINSDISLFREENIPLLTEVAKLQRNYGEIQGAMTITYEDEELTMPRAADFLQKHDRKLREEIYHKIQQRRLKDSDSLNELLGKLISLRHQIGKNAGFSNFRDYKFVSMGRFDYTPADCFHFHEAVRLHIVPMLDELASLRKQKLGYDRLRPWDTAVDVFDQEVLKPFEDGQDLIAKTKEVFRKVDPYFEECLSTLEALGHLDLNSRKGKSPGGYNYPLMETGAPFIFMNATSNIRDMVTLLHEGGHAVHSFLTADLDIAYYKELPSEIAELASMSMELLTMDYWEVYFPKKEDLVRAKYRHLEQIIQTLPWVATIDKFQHWLYEHPQHTDTERNMAWNTIYSEFTDSVVDYSGLELYKYNIWQKQLHIYEVPFYYIEYGIAQLGAVALWKNFRSDPLLTIQQYKEALSLGNTRSIPEVYQTAGIRFDFSSEYILSLMQFVRKEMEDLIG